jgi:hypothetical protein
MKLSMKVLAGAVVVFAALLSMVLGPVVAEAGGPYFSSLYASIKIVNSGYQTIADSLRVGKTLIVQGATTLNGALTVAGAQTYPTTVCDTNSFVAKALTDTTTVSGAAVTDKYIATYRTLGTAWDSLGTMTIQPTATGFVAHRDSAAARLESGAKYTWLRFK